MITRAWGGKSSTKERIGPWGEVTQRITILETGGRTVEERTGK